MLRGTEPGLTNAQGKSSNRKREGRKELTIVFTSMVQIHYSNHTISVAHRGTFTLPNTWALPFLHGFHMEYGMRGMRSTSDC